MSGQRSRTACSHQVKIVVVVDREFPDGRDEAEAVQCVAAIEVHRGGVHHFFAADCGSEIADGLDGADAHAAVESALKAFAARGEKVAGPAVEADAVDEILLALRGFEVVLAAGIVGIADAAVAIAVVDAVLAPDLSLANVDAFIGSEKALVLRIHETGDEALRTIAAADHVGDHRESRVNGLRDCARACRTWARSSRRE